MDLNHRRVNPPDLQSGALDRSATPPPFNNLEFIAPIDNDCIIKTLYCQQKCKNTLSVKKPATDKIRGITKKILKYFSTLLIPQR